MDICCHHGAMCSNSELQNPADRQGNRFTTTRWSMVVAAGVTASPIARVALSMLCETYWYPLYAYARRRGYAHQDAQDLIQSFFASLLESESLRDADPQRGKFRAFLLTALKNFAAKQWRSESIQKRGGTSLTLSLDCHDAEARYLCEPKDGKTPEASFDRKWAIATHEAAMWGSPAGCVQKEPAGIHIGSASRLSL
ncbi:Sigma-70 region 2 [Roseimaritima multifibrata]|uniref:Sigma-70 region 2 n=2 Tax=Roseimaritima multifibrata TaxID=1930274 RepID=A0A517MIJ5_9BACT|nr:Sigma-70 region 2 [Roseimaritima multifibrata]